MPFDQKRFRRKRVLKRMRGSAQHAGPPRQFMPGFIGFLELGTYIRTHNLFRPISTIKAQKESPNRLDDPHSCGLITPASSSRLAPSETGCVLDPSAEANLARRSSRKTPPDVVTPLRQRRIKAAGRRNLGRHDGLPSREPNPCLLSKPRLSAPLAPGECSGSAKPNASACPLRPAAGEATGMDAFACVSPISTPS